jgi:hypothetical protein
MFKKVGFVAVRLLLIPGITEGIISGFVAVGLFGMPILIGLALGFILKPVDPAIAIQIMSQYQKEGRGVAKGGQNPALCLTVLFPGFGVGYESVPEGGKVRGKR